MLSFGLDFCFQPHLKSCPPGPSLHAAFASVVTSLLSSAPSVGWAFLQPPCASHPGSFFNLSLIGLPVLLGGLIGHKHIPRILSLCEFCLLLRGELTCSVGSEGKMYFMLCSIHWELTWNCSWASRAVRQHDKQGFLTYLFCTYVLTFYFLKVVCCIQKATIFEVMNQALISALPVICCVILGRSLNVFEIRFSYPWVKRVKFDGFCERSQGCF